MALVKAKFTYEKDKSEKTVTVHFNPSEYSIASAQLDQSSVDKSRGVLAGKVGESDIETLSFKLYFDTYTRFWDPMDPSTLMGATESRGDVRAYTEEIAQLAKSANKGKPVTFEWGSLIFSGIVESVTQKFTMFLDDGKPVRAELNIVMKRTSGISTAAFGAKSHSTINLSNPAWKIQAAALVTAGKLRNLLDSFV